MKSKRHSFASGGGERGDVGTSAQVLEQPQHNDPLPAQVPTQPIRPIMAPHFADGRKAVRSRMQRKLEDDGGAANTRGRGWDAGICMFLSTSTSAAIDCPRKGVYPQDSPGSSSAVLPRQCDAEDAAKARAAVLGR